MTASCTGDRLPAVASNDDRITCSQTRYVVPVADRLCNRLSVGPLRGIWTYLTGVLPADSS